MLKITPGLNALGVPNVLRNAVPRTIAMISGLSAAIPARLRSSDAAVAIVTVNKSPGSSGPRRARSVQRVRGQGVHVTLSG